MENTMMTEAKPGRDYLEELRTGIPSAETIEFNGGCEECAKYALRATATNREGTAHNLAHRKRAVDGLRAVAATKDWERFFRCVKKAQGIFGHSSVCSDVWATAMTLVFGPVGLHESRTDANGRPTAEALQIPSVARAMAEAEERLPGVLRGLEICGVERFAEWAGLPIPGQVS